MLKKWRALKCDTICDDTDVSVTCTAASESNPVYVYDNSYVEEGTVYIDMTSLDADTSVGTSEDSKINNDSYYNLESDYPNRNSVALLDRLEVHTPATSQMLRVVCNFVVDNDDNNHKKALLTILNLQWVYRLKSMRNNRFNRGKKNGNTD
jgi:hypothetical protein